MPIPLIPGHICKKGRNFDGRAMVWRTKDVPASVWKAHSRLWLLSDDGINLYDSEALPGETGSGHIDGDPNALVVVPEEWLPFPKIEESNEWGEVSL